MINRKEIQELYNDACNEYLQAFCEKHDFDYDEASRSWVANEVGGVCLLGDYYISFDDMKTDIDMGTNENEFFNYYDYSLDAHELGFNCPNYKNWLRGCPRLSPEQIKSIREAKMRVYESEEKLKRIIKEETEKVEGGF